MKKKISFDYDEKAGLTMATLKTSKGTFYGMSCKHPDDKFPSSYSIGTNIAEARAYINLYNKLIADKTIELKGLQRLMNSMPDTNEGFHYVSNLYYAIKNERCKFKDERAYWKAIVKNNIEARGIYLRSRTTNKKEKEAYLKKLGEGIEMLGKLNKDKND